LRRVGKQVPAAFAGDRTDPAKIAGRGKFLPGQPGNSFPFASNADDGKPAILRKILVHDETAPW
jgi:hypothetical protein